jgi:GNAT superfamily N-acetyltransferase
MNVEAPGFEETENALMLLEPPPGQAAEGVDVVVVQTIEEMDAANGILEQAFGLPEGSFSANREEDWERYQQPGYPFPQLLAMLSGRPVGSATAAYCEAGVNLFGGGVLEDARGEGVYRALIAKRWELAVERGTPALTVQAGRMSRPILERVGFQFVDPVKIYADLFAGE